jgi:hypothetical protein
MEFMMDEGLFIIDGSVRKEQKKLITSKKTHQYDFLNFFLGSWSQEARRHGVHC